MFSLSTTRFYPFLFLPLFAHAQTTLGDLMDDLTDLFGDIASLLIGVAVVVFFWGIIRFITHAGTAPSDEKAREEGKQLMIWGMIALFVMVALWSILGFVQSELNLDTGLDLGDLPQQSSTIPTPW